MSDINKISKKKTKEAIGALLRQCSPRELANDLRNMHSAWIRSDFSEGTEHRAFTHTGYEALYEFLTKLQEVKR